MLSDPLTEVLRSGARALLAQAVAAEVAGFLEGHTDKLTDDGRQRLVRHGHLPGGAIMTGIGPVAVRAPRIRDRVGTGEERIAFSSAILPPYARRSKSLEVLIPILYLKGISTGGFEEALAALLGNDAGGLSASTIARLRDVWADEHTRWQKRDVSQALRLFLGRRHPCASPARERCAVPARDHRRDTRRQQGARRPHRRCAGECAILERAAARPKAARAGDRA